MSGCDSAGIFKVVGDALGEANLAMLDVMSNGEEIDMVNDPAPNVVEVIEMDEMPIALGGSPLHGIGVFATRDIYEWDVVEVVPTLPVPSAVVEQTILIHYTFNPYFLCSGVDLLHLGYGAMYNHSKASNVIHLPFEDTPYLQVWIADKFVPKGHELLLDYGDEYWKTRHLEAGLV